VAVFAAMLGVATGLHWDRFTHGHISFYLWAVLYFSLPFVIPVVWYANTRANAGISREPEHRFPRALVMSLGLVSAVLLVASVVFAVLPQFSVLTWPWALTPLTARVLAAMFALPGLVGLGAALDGRWSAARVPFQAQVISIVFILLGLVRARQDVAWSRWESPLFVAGLFLELVLIGWAALWSARSRQAPGGVVPV
jgi:amino acid transporter